MNIRLLIAVLTCSFLLITVTARAGEFVTNAEVIEVTPITEVSRIVEQRRCRVAKPARDDLLSTLRWDLGINQCQDIREQTQIVGYDVSYVWQEQVYTRRMTNKPGSHIPLRITLN